MPEGEFHRLHGASVLLEALKFVRQFIGAIFVLVLIRFTRGEGGEMELWFAGLGLLALIPALFTYFTVRYGLENGSLVVTKGVLFRQHRTIPLERIQNVAIRRTVMHRLLGVSAVDVETASGAGAEASLEVVSEKEAERLRSELLNRVAPTQEAPLEVPPLYRATLKNLALAGATQNRALLIVAGIVGLFGFLRDTLDVGPPNVPGFLMTQNLAILFAVSAFLLLFVAGWALSIAMTVVNYYGFTLRTASGGLQVKHGLFTHLESVIPHRRVQVLRVEAPLFQRLLKVCHVYVVTAGSFVDKATGGPSPLCPLIERAEADRFAKLIYRNLDLDNVEWQPVSKFARRRAFVGGMLLWLVLASGSSFMIGREAFWLLLPATLYQWWYSGLYQKGLAWSRQGNFLLSREGALGRSIKAVPIDRIQWVSVSQSPFQRRLGLANLLAVTAGQGQGFSLEVPFIPESLARSLQDELTNVRRGRSLESGGV